MMSLRSSIIVGHSLRIRRLDAVFYILRDELDFIHGSAGSFRYEKENGEQKQCAHQRKVRQILAAWIFRKLQKMT